MWLYAIEIQKFNGKDDFEYNCRFITDTLPELLYLTIL